MEDRVKGIVLTIISAIIYGFSPLLSKSIYELGGNSIELSFFRMLIAALVMWLLTSFVAKESIGIRVRELKKLFICAQGFCLAPALLWTSYNYLPSGLSTTIHFVYPVLVLIGCVVCYRAKVTAAKVISCTLCLLGILCFYNPDGTISLWGVFIAFASGVVYAYYIIYLEKSGLGEMHPYKLCFWLSLIGAAEMYLIARFTGNLTLDVTVVGWAITIVFALLTGGVAAISFQLGTKYVGAQSASLLSTFEPLTSVVVGVIVYNEDVSGKTLIGIVAILLSVIIVSVSKSSKE